MTGLLKVPLMAHWLSSYRLSVILLSHIIQNMGNFLKISHDNFRAHTCQFTNIHMFNAIKANSTKALLQAISINRCLPKPLSQTTPSLPSLSPGSSVQLQAACPCEYFIMKNSGYPSSEIIKNILLTKKIYNCALKAVNYRHFGIRLLRISWILYHTLYNQNLGIYIWLRQTIEGRTKQR